MHMAEILSSVTKLTSQNDVYLTFFFSKYSDSLKQQKYLLTCSDPRKSG